MLSRPIPLLILLTLPIVGQMDRPNFLTKAEKAQGWELLFDGTTTSGWLEVTGKPFPASSWTIEDGSLKAKPNPAGMQDIRTVETFCSFELEFEWRCAANGNSGVKYLLLGVDSWPGKQGSTNARGRAFEYQLGGEDADPKARSDLKYAAGSLYGVLAPGRRVAHTAGEFTRARLVVRGGHVEHWMGGQKLLEFELDSPEFARDFEASRKRRLPGRDAWESPIVLQNHNTEFWFRNIRIRRLP